MSEKKLYHISDVLTISTGLLVSTKHVEGIYDILNYMTGDCLSTHQLPRAAKLCKPYLIAQYPFLANIKPPDFIAGDKETITKWTSEMAETHGDLLFVKPLDEYEFKDPIQEAVEIMGENKVLAVSSSIKPDELIDLLRKTGC